MQSAFANTKQLPGATAQAAVEEVYTLAGLNLRDPDEIMPAGDTPYTTNSRMYARNDGESRVANRTRQGASFLSTPVGQTLDTQNVGSVTSGDFAFGVLADGTDRILAQSFTPTTNGAITRLDLELRKDSGSTGEVIVEIRSNASGLPSSTVLAQGSILGSLLTTSQAFYTAYFIDAPTLSNSTLYWIVVYQQDNGTNSYYGNRTNGSGAFSSVGGTSWSNVAGEFRYKTYISTTGKVRGYGLYYPSDSTKNNILFAQHGNVYAAPKSTGTPALLDSTLVDATGPIRFLQLNDWMLWCDGTTTRYWDGTNVATLTGVPSGVSNLLVYANRLFVLTQNNLVTFSDLLLPGVIPTWTNTNFFYIGAPKSSDHVTGWMSFQDKLIITTHQTKWIVTGTDISTFTIKQAMGTKGAVSQEGMDADRNFIYFMAPDRQIYAFNGVADTWLSEKVQPELMGVTTPSFCNLHVYRNQIRIYYPKTPSTFCNRMLLYDLEFKAWLWDTNHAVGISAELYQDDDELIEFSSLVGQIFYGETQYSDLGRKIEWEYRTNYKNYAWRKRNGQTFGGATAKKRIKRYRPIVRTVGESFIMMTGIDHDFANQPDLRPYLIDGGGAKWGAFVWDDGSKWGPGVAQIQNRAGASGRAAFIQYRFLRTGVNTPVELLGYASLYRLGKQK